MTSKEATIAAIDALEDLVIPYMIAGSFASTYYGVSRLTKDADFVVEFGDHSVSEIMARLGLTFCLDPQMSFESVKMTTRHIITVPEIMFAIELFHLTDEPHDEERFRRRRRVGYLGRTVSLPTAEDVIVTKLRWALLSNRSKDRDDVQAVLAIRGPTLDWDYVYRWCAQHGTRALLDEIRQSIPPV